MAALARLAPRWLRRPRSTARRRLTAFYSVLFLLSGACLLAIPYLLVRDTGAGTITVNPARHSYTYIGPDGVNNAVIGPPRALGRAMRFGAKQSLAALEQLRRLAASQHAGELHQLLRYSAIALAVMAAASVLLGWLVAGRVLRPVRTISATARRISASNLHERLELDGPDDEFRELAATLNDLLQRLAASFEAQRRFVANASHELRTPLTVERTLLQVALADPETTLATLRGVCEKLLASSADQERLIDALLTLASSERGLEQQETFDLAELVRRAVAAGALDQARGRGLRLHTDLASAHVVGDLQLAQQLVSNLLDNAIRHNHDRGRIAVATGMRAGRPFLAVVNTGPVVPEADTGRLLEPFQQLAGRRTACRRDGHGLGLAIVAAIAAAHHAELSLRPRHAGGLAVAVLFDGPGVPAGERDPRSASQQSPPLGCEAATAVTLSG